METQIGQPVRRKEDYRLLTGQGRFSDDFNAPGQLHAAMVRSPHPHARFRGIATDAARAMPGVRAVYTGADCAADGLGAIPHSPVPSTKSDLKLTAPGGGEIFIGPHLPLPADKARHAGEAVAMVVADTLAQALDAAEAVAVDYEVLPSVADSSEAAAPGAPDVWDECPGNVLVDTSFGDAAATEAAFARADREVRLSFHIGRLTGVPLEPRAALAVPDGDTTTLYAGSGGAVRQRREIAATLGIAPEALRVVSADVGGNFGTRNRVYVEFVLVAWASRKLGRPVKYVCDRSEAFLSDYQGRDLVTELALALDRDGRFLALTASNLSNVGARCVSLSPLGKGSALVTGPYAIPHATVRSRAVFTNTVPTQAYRSSGRPEVTFALERLVETAAATLGIDAVELRRRNLVASSAMPYANPFGMHYDSGTYAENMATALRLADAAGFPARRAEAAARGRLRGLGVASYVESSIGTPREQAEITVRPEGAVDLVIGTQPSGQGHETSFAQVAADWLGVAPGQVNIILGDTALVSVGGGSHSGRSMRMAGTVIVLACDELIEKGKRIASYLLEAAEGDIEFAAGRFRVVGTDRSIGLFDVAARASDAEVPEPLRDGLSVVRDNLMETAVFPNGCHVCEAEIDRETGAVEIVAYAAVDDVGCAINPMIVEGQTHGGIVQGAGQALGEACVIAPDTGQPLAGSLMDYALPRAADMPSFVTVTAEIPSPTNPLGVKAGGEGGTTGSPAAITNAIVDALRPLGVTDLAMPATPFNVWRAIQATERPTNSSPTFSQGPLAAAYRSPRRS